MNSLILRVGGEAGWGIATAADILAKLAIKLGYQIFSSKDYASQIKGGHNYHTIRISELEVSADLDKIDVLLALDKKTLDKHLLKTNLNGIVLYNDKINLEQVETNKTFIPINLKQIEENLNQKNIQNAVFLGVTAKSLSIEFEILASVIKEHFHKKLELGENLIKAAQAGYDSVSKIKELPNLGKNNNPKFLNGNDAITLGALKAGLTFHAQYPMTPVSGILHNLAKEAVNNQNLTVIQPEDEIATINMALGASYAGARAMTATSGGGFALMIESMGLAGMAEIPLVVIEGQRPGPSTGLPTKTEQGDLKFVLSAGTGDFPHIVVAPGSIEECYTETKRAFYLAEKYQLPAIVLVDKNQTESFKTINLEQEENNFTFDYNQKINIINEIPESELNEDGIYKRYAANNSKRTIPGTVNGIYTCAGDEHDDVGCITEDKQIRNQMMERRMSKLKSILNELPDPKLIGHEDADLTVVSWGSNHGAIKEAVDKLNLEGEKVNFLSIKFMLPFQTEQIKEFLTKSKRLVLIENNYSGQLGELISEKTGIQIYDKILKSDGSTFTVDEIYNELNKQW